MALGGQTALTLVTQPNAAVQFQGALAFLLLALPLLGLVAALVRRPRATATAARRVPGPTP
jgi:hypothetical protein